RIGHRHPPRPGLLHITARLAHRYPELAGQPARRFHHRHPGLHQRGGRVDPLGVLDAPHPPATRRADPIPGPPASTRAAAALIRPACSTPPTRPPAMPQTYYLTC